MRKINLMLLCSSVFLYACDGANDTANRAAEQKAADNVVATTGTAVEAVEEAVTEVDSAAEEVAAETVTTTTTSEEVASAGADEGSPGESIFKSKCNACHGTGVAGAPKLGDKAAWAPRIAQGEAVLTQHAIEGFKGKTGIMPPKGGFASLSDEEISAVVQYMVSQSK